MMNTYRVTHAKTGNKIHRSHVGFAKSDCGVRAFDVRCTPAQLVAHASVICERCFSPLAVLVGLSISDAFRALAKWFTFSVAHRLGRSYGSLMTNTNNTANETTMATNTESIPVGTPVTIRIGSGRYAATVVKSTKRTCTVKYDGRDSEERTFRLTTPDARYYTYRQHHYLAVIGVGVTELDRSF